MNHWLMKGLEYISQPAEVSPPLAGRSEASGGGAFSRGLFDVRASCGAHLATLRVMRCAAGILLTSLALGCEGGVEHPPAGQPNTRKYCADRKDSENNCMACSSQPGCGWCDVPQSGQSHCQPGTSHDAPGSCSEGWALSTDMCAAPPPPPPPPPPLPSSSVAEPTEIEDSALSTGADSEVDEKAQNSPPDASP